MSKEQLLEKLSEVGKSRGIDRDVLRTVVDMFSVFTDTLDQALTGRLEGGPDTTVVKQIADDVNSLVAEVNELKVLNSVSDEVRNELHIVRNDVDGLNTSYKELVAKVELVISKKPDKIFNTLQSDLDKLGQSVVALENRMDKLFNAKTTESQTQS
jgi:archaellum component FlaC